MSQQHKLRILLLYLRGPIVLVNGDPIKSRQKLACLHAQQNTTHTCSIYTSSDLGPWFADVAVGAEQFDSAESKHSGGIVILMAAGEEGEYLRAKVDRTGEEGGRDGGGEVGGGAEGEAGREVGLKSLICMGSAIS
jgi:hypothetical protein